MSTRVVNHYGVGAEVVIRGIYRNRSGVKMNPTTGTAKIKRPDGTVVPVANYAATAVAGEWEGTYITEQEGTHYYNTRGVGVVTAVDQWTFVVDKDKVEGD